jgi:toxin CptA
MGALAAASFALSAVPASIGWAAGTICLVAGLHGAWRELREPVRQLVWRHDAPAPVLHGPAGEETWGRAEVRWRGPLATLGGHDGTGTLRRLSWWPDTLPPEARRALRLASARRPDPAAAGPAPTPHP